MAAAGLTVYSCTGSMGNLVEVIQRETLHWPGRRGPWWSSYENLQFLSLQRNSCSRCWSLPVPFPGDLGQGRTVDLLAADLGNNRCIQLHCSMWKQSERQHEQKGLAAEKIGKQDNLRVIEWPKDSLYLLWGHNHYFVLVKDTKWLLWVGHDQKAILNVSQTNRRNIGRTCRHSPSLYTTISTNQLSVVYVFGKNYSGTYPSLVE